MVTISFHVAGDDAPQILARFTRFGQGVKDPFGEGAGDNIADDFLAIERAQFSSQGTRGGMAWAPLQPSTIKQKERRGQPLDILVATGRMRAALTTKGHPDAVREISGDTLALGLRLESFPSFYPLFHVTGTLDQYRQRRRVPGEGMPRRPPIELNDEDKRRWYKYVQARLVAAARGTDIAGIGRRA